MWVKPKARKLGDSWNVYSDLYEAMGGTLEEAYRQWAWLAGIPMWLAEGKGA